MVVLNLDEFWPLLDGRLSKLVSEQKPETKYMRSSEVREMLNISDSTLQTLRITGAIPAYRLGTSWFYKYEEIVAAIDAGRLSRGGIANE